MWRRMLILVAVVACVCTGARLWMSSTGQLHAAPFNPAVPHNAPIPKEALRLRIIANSDSPADQQLKREVRNAIVLQVGQWMHGVTSSTEARDIVESHVAELQSIALHVVREHGFHYGVQTAVAKVHFPTKIYGNQIYPAGRYEALRIILGKGQGANWWCVLFPPLCFVDIAEGDAVPNTGSFPDIPPLEVLRMMGPNGKMEKVQVRIAALDYGEELWHTIKNKVDPPKFPTHA
ncbi:stage II sporulation protein R [Alicyclobacillus sp. SP_1]|uniref:stage II sporulation protein R n=1 Tax=Alicyclobacillus sp. SP_1 TaxID=2942475 RepID=UPI00215757CF|nr:stage II sporulation protein R [Alicyclobacillus sp. SP_1]